MRTALLAAGLMLGSSAWAGDVWMEMDIVDGEGSLHVELPALAGATADEFKVLQGGKEVDWMVEIARLSSRRVGAKERYTLVHEDGGTSPLLLEHRVARPGRVANLDVSIAGGFLATLPLKGGQGTVSLSDGASSLIAQTPFPAFDMDNDLVLAALERAAPTTLIRIADADGNDVMVRIH